MNLKNCIAGCVLALTAMSASAVDKANRMFAYPEPPDELELLSERADYIVSHFWDRCNLETATRDKELFRATFEDWVSFMPYTSTQALRSAVDSFLAAYAKRPNDLVEIAAIAEDLLYEGNGEFSSDEIFLPFAQAVATNKKVPKASRARMDFLATMLQRSQPGQIATDIVYTRADGSKGRLSDLKGRHVLLFINDPSCYDCMVARVRLSADHNINQLIEDGHLAVVSILPDAPTDPSELTNPNPRWEFGWADDVDQSYDMRELPALYYLDANQTILSKRLSVDGLLEGFRVALNKLKTQQ